MNTILVDRIASNPNPRRGNPVARAVRQSIAWGRKLDRPRAFEAARTMFAIVGAVGYSGYLSAMHVVLAVISLALLGATWFGVYSMMTHDG